ncbi:MAG: hypothetical protein ABUL49_02015 [bacterium]
MSSALLVLSLVLGDDPRSLGVKARARLEGAPASHLVYDFTSTDNKVPAVVTIDMKLPLRQHVTAKSGAASYEFFQCPEGAVAIDHPSKEYFDYQPVSFILGMPPVGLLEDCLPPTLFWPVPQFRQVDKWKVLKGGTPATLQLVFTPVGGAAITFEEVIDPDGKMLSLSATSKSPIGDLVQTWKLREEDLTEKGQASITNSVPEGYVPALFSQSINTINPGIPFPVVKAPNARGGDSVRMIEEGKPGVIVVTAPDDPISTDIEPVLKELKPQVEKAGGTMTELSLSTSPLKITTQDAARPIAYDPDGSIDRMLRVQMTPYFLVTNKNGVMVRGFAGYASDQHDILFKVLLEALAYKKPVTTNIKVRSGVAPGTGGGDD